MVGQFIDTFWRKSFIGDLRRARKVSEDDTQWTLVYDGKAHQFQFVWIQGICVKVGYWKIKYPCNFFFAIKQSSQFQNKIFCRSTKVRI
jgi:hypothetical protein